MKLIATAFSETKSLKEWVKDKRCVVSYAVLQQRIQKCGWSPEKAIVTPTRVTVFITGLGETKSLTEWSCDDRCLVSSTVLRSRVRLGWELEKALVEPNQRERVIFFGDRKRCSACQEIKPLLDFYTSRSSKDGFAGYCIPCSAEYNRDNTNSSAVSLRLQAIEHLGAKCAECGFSDIRALQIDHVEGGGAAERKLKGGNRATYKLALEDTFGKYQVLCANCNWIKKSIMQENGNYFDKKDSLTN